MDPGKGDKEGIEDVMQRYLICVYMYIYIYVTMYHDIRDTLIHIQPLAKWVNVGRLLFKACSPNQNPVHSGSPRKVNHQLTNH